MYHTTWFGWTVIQTEQDGRNRNETCHLFHSCYSTAVKQWFPWCPTVDSDTEHHPVLLVSVYSVLCDIQFSPIPHVLVVGYLLLCWWLVRALGECSVLLSDLLPTEHRWDVMIGSPVSSSSSLHFQRLVGLLLLYFCIAAGTSL